MSLFCIMSNIKMNQNDQLDTLIHKFKDKIDTHPELAKLWVHYLTIKQARLKSVIEQAEQTLQMFETTDDIPTHTIALVYLMERYTNETTNA